jgi:oligopeptide/dipeptide ABC transporter ATP-binding protein
METKLQVRNLRISFRTTNGKVQAVRGIDFDLAKGETLAIVGESGSGKSVTSKAILGIQANNAVTESGEIIYDGKDLLKISEEEFHKIRGDKIAMIFQDPMSSLNPIVKIGRQLTEAMLLKGKARQRESRKNFNETLKSLNAAMIQALAPNDSEKAAKLTQMCKDFDKFEFKHIELESAYAAAHEAAVEALDDLDVLIFELEKHADKDATDRVNDIATQAAASVNEYVVKEEAEQIKTLAGSLNTLYKDGQKSGDQSKTISTMEEIREILRTAAAKEAPNFFRMGYYVTFANEPLPAMPVAELNEFLLKYLDGQFMTEFLNNTVAALEHTAKQSYENMAKAVEALEQARSVYSKENLDRKESYDTHKALSAAVLATVDPLNIHKDSLTYTFSTSLKSELDTYFHAITGNAKAIKVHDKDQRKHDKLTARGKTPDWEVAAAATVNMDLVKQNIDHLLERLAEHYRELLSRKDSRDYKEQAVELVDFFKANASGVVDKVTKRIAKRRAIKLMDEVGIAEPHRRYNQYPFEFSGGMRQRIVIAIALAANPDILICDEPTTALDVTIQSQILELINKLKRERQLSVIFITHDLGVVANMADRVAVMYAGKIVEYGTAEDIFYRAAHPYTWALMSSMPDLDTNEKLEAIPGTPPNMIYPPVGDAFAARNKYAMQIDFEQQPPMFQISDTHYAATWLLHPDAPKVEMPKIIVDRIRRMKEKNGGAADGE